MEVHGTGPVHGTPHVSPTRRNAAPEPSPSTPAGEVRDELEISEMGNMLDDLSRSGEVRLEKILEIRREIEAGTYETPEKLAVAVERLLEEIEGRS